MDRVEKRKCSPGWFREKYANVSTADMDKLRQRAAHHAFGRKLRPEELAELERWRTSKKSLFEYDNTSDLNVKFTFRIHVGHLSVGEFYGPNKGSKKGRHADLSFQFYSQTAYLDRWLG